MDLNTVWFLLIGVLFTGFFILEGFDYGVGILLPILGKNDPERRVVINTIGPVWDGNEVWVLTAGGAIFAAFPNWYATMFSGFYLALFLILLALIVRAVSFEFRSKDARPAWRRTWDGVIFGSSLVLAILWGVAVTNLLRGVPIDANQQYVGDFWTLLNPYALLGGLTTLGLFTLQGAIYLNLKTTDAIRARALAAVKTVWPITTVVVVAFVAATAFATDAFTAQGALPIVLAGAAAVALLATGGLSYLGRTGWAFALNSLTIALAVATLFAGLFPRVMVSSLNSAWNLTIYNASSSPYTLQVMTIGALIFVPVVLAYQAWTYWVFRKRVGPHQVHY